MLFVLEGCDCTGKSTLAKELSIRSGFPIIHGSSFERAQQGKEKMLEWFRILASKDDMIIDRYIFSNLVYASLYEGNELLTTNEWKEFEKMIMGRTIVFYLHASDEVISNRLEARGDSYIDKSHIQMIKNEYMKVMSQSDLSIIKVDSEKADPKRVAELFLP